jgi:oligopeptide transport system substrate-binding protein
MRMRKADLAGTIQSDRSRKLACERNRPQAGFLHQIELHHHSGSGHGRALVALSLCVFTAFLGACSKPANDSAAEHQILRLGQRNEPSNLDPALATLPDEFAILRALCEGLLIPGANGEPQPGAASRFDVSPDGLVYTFHLRPDGRWSDGEPVTAAHFVESFRRVLTPATAAPKANVFFAVKNAQAFVKGTLADFSAVGFRAVSPHVLEITLERPTRRFPFYVSSGPWLPTPVRVVEKHGRTWTQPGRFVGNGPFTLAEWRQDQRISVKKNPHWHGAATVRLREIQFLRFDSGDSEDRAYRAGQIHVTMAVPFSKVEGYTAERPAELHRAAMSETRYFCFNTQRKPLNDERVRRALSLALDRRMIVERVLKGGQQTAGRFVPPALRESETAAATPALAQIEHRHDPEEARRLLASTEFAGKNFPRLEVTAWSATQVPVLEAAQQMWRQVLGIDVAIAIREARVHWNALDTGDYDIAFVSAIPDVADIAQLLGDYVSEAPDNYPHWSNAAYDQIFSKAVVQRDPTARAETFANVERLLLESAPVAPVYFNTKIWLMSPRVRGWQEDGLWTRCYHNVYLHEK